MWWDADHECLGCSQFSRPARHMPHTGATRVSAPIARTAVRLVFEVLPQRVLLHLPDSRLLLEGQESAAAAGGSKHTARRRLSTGSKHVAAAPLSTRCARARERHLHARPTHTAAALLSPCACTAALHRRPPTPPPADSSLGCAAAAWPAVAHAAGLSAPAGQDAGVRGAACGRLCRWLQQRRARRGGAVGRRQTRAGGDGGDSKHLRCLRCQRVG